MPWKALQGVSLLQVKLQITAMEESNKGQVILYQTEDGQTRLEVQFKDESLWLSLDQMAELFQRDKSTISRHIRNVFEDGELNSEVEMRLDAIFTL